MIVGWSGQHQYLTGPHLPLKILESPLGPLYSHVCVCVCVCACVRACVRVRVCGSVYFACLEFNFMHLFVC